MQPATFDEIRFGGPGNATVVVSFTADLDRHAAALTQLVDVPNGVVVCPQRSRPASRVALANDLMARTAGAFYSLSPQSRPPQVTLRADRRDLADELIRDYGPRVSIVLGSIPYPDPDAAGPRPYPPGRGCGTLPTPSKLSSSLRWSVAAPLRTHSGGDLAPKLRITNVGGRTVSFEYGIRGASSPRWEGRRSWPRTPGRSLPSLRRHAPTRSAHQCGWAALDRELRRQPRLGAPTREILRALPRGRLAGQGRRLQPDPADDHEGSTAAVRSGSCTAPMTVPAGCDARSPCAWSAPGGRRAWTRGPARSPVGEFLRLVRPGRTACMDSRASLLAGGGVHAPGPFGEDGVHGLAGRLAHRWRSSCAWSAPEGQRA